MRRLLIPVVGAVICVASMLFQSRTVDPSLCAAPEVQLSEISGFTSEVLEPSEAELHTLPTDTVIHKRRYLSPDGHWHLVTVVIGGRYKSSIHRPEMCLPTQGFQMMSPRSLEVAGIDWRLVALARRDAPVAGFAYTFFNQDGFRTASHLQRIFLDVWDRSVRGQIDRWVMVTVYSSTSEARIVSGFLKSLKGVIFND